MFLFYQQVRHGFISLNFLDSAGYMLPQVHPSYLYEKMPYLLPTPSPYSYMSIRLIEITV
jgi:hypothetical protein